jgi:hypothetical protein
VERFSVLDGTALPQAIPWPLLEAGAGWALGKEIVTVLNQVAPSSLSPPLSRHQACIVETSQQRGDLAEELADLKSQSQSRTMPVVAKQDGATG